jgi:hypothetical protein
MVDSQGNSVYNRFHSHKPSIGNNSVKKFLFLNFLLLCTLLLFFFRPLELRAQSREPDFALLKKQVQHLRGLRFTRDVPVVYFSDRELKEYLTRIIYSREQEEALSREEVTLKSFGFIDPAFKLKEFYVSLYLEQVAGLYDYQDKRFIIARDAIEREKAPDKSMPMDVESSVIVHELDHALQDQQFNLGAFIGKLEKATMDESLAGQALFEGDATYVMFDYMLSSLNLSIDIVPPQIFQTMSGLFESSLSSQKNLAEAPPYFREVSLFPYSVGFAYIKTVKKSTSWNAVNALYGAPPRSTSQVLHPERYGSGERPAALPLPQDAPEGWKMAVRGSLGEFLTGVLFKQYLGKDEQEKAAALRGDAYEVFSKGRERMLLWRMKWSSAEDAGRAFDILKALYSRRYANVKWDETKESGEARASLGNGTSLLITQSEDYVQILDGWTSDRDLRNLR